MNNVFKTLLQKLAALSPNCKEATRLQSDALDRRLTSLDRFSLRCHLIICKWCRCYGKQINFLSSAARKLAEDDQPAPPPGLSPEARERIKRRLQSERE